MDILLTSATVLGTDATVSLTKRTEDPINTWISETMPLYRIIVECPSGLVEPFEITSTDYEEIRGLGIQAWNLVRDARDAKKGTKPEAPQPKRYTIAEGFWQIKCQGEEPIIYKVQRSQETGYLYGKRLDPDGFRYAKGALRDLRECGEPLDEETATKFGKLYGVCAICGRTLTNEESIERGIGPVCAGRQGW